MLANTLSFSSYHFGAFWTFSFFRSPLSLIHLLDTHYMKIWENWNFCCWMGSDSYPPLQSYPSLHGSFVVCWLSNAPLFEKESAPWFFIYFPAVDLNWWPIPLQNQKVKFCPWISPSRIYLWWWCSNRWGYQCRLRPISCLRWVYGGRVWVGWIFTFVFILYYRIKLWKA